MRWINRKNSPSNECDSYTPRGGELVFPAHLVEIDEIRGSDEGLDVTELSVRLAMGGTPTRKELKDSLERTTAAFAACEDPSDFGLVFDDPNLPE